MAIDYTSMIYGNRNAEQPRRATGSGTSSVDYGQLYSQAKLGNYSNMSAPISGSAAGSADFLADYARRNTQAERAGMTPASFNPLLGPQGMVDPNAPIVNVNKSSQQIFEEAQAKYLETTTASRDLARQGIQRTGADQYSQARMAMEQQMALSDTRGLTAGAREGAQQTLSATQQVALNQIESNIQSQLLELKAQGVQDEFLAQEYGMRQLEINKQLNPEWGKLEILTNNFNAALQLGDKEAAQKALNSMNETGYALLGLDASDIDTKNPNLSIDATRDKLIQRMSQDPSVSEQVWSWVAAFGAIGAGGLMMGAGFFLAPMGIGIPLSVVGAGLMSYGAHLSKVAGDQNLSMERKIQKVNEILAAQRKEFINLGYSPEVVDAELNKYRQTLIPAFQ
jgi:hypothetical protein